MVAVHSLSAARFARQLRSASAAQPSRAALNLRRPAGPERAAARVARRAARREAQRGGGATRRLTRAESAREPEADESKNALGVFLPRSTYAEKITRARGGGCVKGAQRPAPGGRTLDAAADVCNRAFLCPAGPAGRLARPAGRGANRRRAAASGAAARRAEAAPWPYADFGGHIPIGSGLIVRSRWPSDAAAATCRATRRGAGRGTGASRARRAKGPYLAARRCPSEVGAAAALLCPDIRTLCLRGQSRHITFSSDKMYSFKYKNHLKK